MQPKGLFGAPFPWGCEESHADSARGSCGYWTVVRPARHPMPRLARQAGRPTVHAPTIAGTMDAHRTAASPLPTRPSATPAWSRLWAETTAGSIDLAAQDPVAQALRGHWHAQLAWLRSCARVADVGSGPAVLPRLLLDADPGGLAEVRWRCVDRAALPDSLAARLPRTVTLQGDTDFGGSQPPDGTVDALLSNFGLEYVGRDAVATACARWLGPGGRLHAVLHARDSLIDRTSALGHEDIGFALHDTRLFEHAAALLRALATLPADPGTRRTHAVEVRQAYNAAVDALKRRMDGRGAPSAVLLDMLEGLRGPLERTRGGDLPGALGELDARATAYAAEAQRLHDMRQQALDSEQLQALCTALQAAGFERPQVEPLACPLGLVGWCLQARRP